MSTDGYRISFDIGGTFTDLVVLDEAAGQMKIAKVLTTPEDPAEAVIKGIVRLLDMQGIEPGAVSKAVHGATTLVTNIMLEGKGSRTGLITTEGFADVLEIRREMRYEVNDISPVFPPILVPRNLRKEVRERIGQDGRVLVELDADGVAEVVAELAGKGVKAIAVCLLHSYKNPTHEQEVGHIIREKAPHVLISLSSDILPQIREYERTSTTVINAYVQPKISEHLEEMAQRIRSLGVRGELYMMHSSGGIISARTAAQLPVKLIESGPAAGALAAVFYGQLTGLENILSFDLGGTSGKACLIDQGQPNLTTEFDVARVERFKKGSGYPIRIPVINLIEIGAGGGSIGHVDPRGLLKIGPESAGASPGPACYGLGGTEPTVTDADLVLGYLNPDYFLGGEMALDVDAAQRSIQEKIAGPLHMSVLEAACGIHRIVNENMATAAKVHVAEHGKDPRIYTLMAFGGAGPVHAREVARRLSITRMVSPLAAGTLAAIGLLVAPLAMDFVHSYPGKLEEIDWREVNAIYQEMREKGVAALREVGADPGQISLVKTADMRYAGQGREINVPIEVEDFSQASVDSLRQSFYATYQRLHSRVLMDVPIEVLNWRLVARASPPPVKMQRLEQGNQSLDAAIKGQRRAYFPEAKDYLQARVFDHYQLFPGARFEGPAIVEQRECTTVVGPGERVTVDPYLNLIISLNGG